MLKEGIHQKVQNFNSVKKIVQLKEDRKSQLQQQIKEAQEQLEAFVTFIQKSGLGEHIRDKNWAAFARGYNGSEYQKNQYDVKLEKAYKKYASIKNAA